MVSSDTEGTLQLQVGARRIPHTRTERSRSAVDAGMRRLYRSLRYVPRPVRPLLRPLWLTIDRRANPDAERPAGSFPAIRLDRPIRPMTRAEFDELAARNADYRGRHGYLGAAACVTSDLIERFGVTTALELGPNVRPLLSGADVTDRVERQGLEACGQVMLGVLRNFSSFAGRMAANFRIPSRAHGSMRSYRDRTDS